MPLPSTPGYLLHRPLGSQNGPSGLRKPPLGHLGDPPTRFRALAFAFLGAAFWLASATVALSDEPSRPRAMYRTPTRDPPVLVYRQPDDPENPVLSVFGLTRSQAWLDLGVVVATAFAVSAWLSKK